jgi:hypothetical protein
VLLFEHTYGPSVMCSCYYLSLRPGFHSRGSEGVQDTPEDHEGTHKAISSCNTPLTSFKTFVVYKHEKTCDQMTCISFLQKEPLLPKVPAGDAPEEKTVQATRAIRVMQSQDNGNV